MSINKLAFALLGLSIMVVTQAEPSEKFDACMNASDGSTIASIDCLNAEYDRQDKLLNEYYQKAMHNLDAKQQQLLREAQRSWITFRDKNCEVESSLAGGQMASLLYDNCLMTITSDRVEQLAAINQGMLGEY